MPPILIIFIVVAVIFAIFCFAMAIVSGITRGSTKSKNKKLAINKESLVEEIKASGFVVSKEFEALVGVEKFEKGGGVSFDLVPSIGLFIDEENKKIAIATYLKGDIKYINFSDLVKVDVFEDLDSSGANTILKKLNITLRLSNPSDPVYVINVIKKRIFTKTELYLSVSAFQTNVVNELNKIIESK